MKSLKKMVGRNIKLEDYCGEPHEGQILVESVQVAKGINENRYYFQRKDGKTIRIKRGGSDRVIATERGLALKMRWYGGRYMDMEAVNPRFKDSYKFENMAGGQA